MDENIRLQRYLDKFSGRGNYEELQKTLPVFDAWVRIVGDLASHCVLRDIDGSTLIVDVDHPGWMQMFQMKEKTILTSIQQRFPTLNVKSFRIRMVENLAPRRPASPVTAREPDLAPTQEIPADKKRAPGPIDDPELKKLLDSFGDIES